MKKLIATLLLAFAFFAAEGQDFNWSDPGSLTPAFKAPNADDRYGEYISNVTFETEGGINAFYLTIDDSAVKELSQRARFLYGYNTQAVEMRAYPGSIITISTKKNGIEWIQFVGPKVDENYLRCLEEDNVTCKDGRWTFFPAPSNFNEVKFEVLSTINCFKTECMHATAGVNDITVDSDDDRRAMWYTLEGRRLNSSPEAPGLYIRQGATTTKVLIR